MPKVWSEKAQSRIETAVSILIHRNETVKTVADVARQEDLRIANELLSNKEIDIDGGIAFDRHWRSNGVEYAGRTICRYTNGLGYVIGYTATPDTFETNLMRFESFLESLLFIQPTDAPDVLRRRNHYELACEYYKFGPTHADIVIAELKQHLAENQEDDQAVIMMSITQKGIGRFDEAIHSLVEAQRLVDKKGRFNPSLLMLRAECHFHKKEFQKAHDILKPAYTFFVNDKEEQKRYNGLMSAIEEQIKNTEVSQ